MSNPYVQVALTYIRRPFSSLEACLYTAGFLGLNMLFVHGTHSFRSLPFDGHSILFPLIMTAYWAGLLAAHVKNQFAESRCHLMPNFRRVHIAVAAGATLILAVGASAVLTWLTGLRSFGLVAVAVFVLGAVFWLVVALSNWVSWVIIPLLLLTSSETVMGALALFISGQFEAQATGLLALGSAMIVATGMRLYRLNEDMPEYHRRMPSRWSEGGRTADDRASGGGFMPRAMADWLREQAMADLTRHARCAGRSPWSRICRWQVAMPSGWRVLLWGLCPLAFFLFDSLISSRPMSGIHPHNAATSSMVTGSFAIWPMMLAMLLLTGFMARARMLGYEVMLPVARRAYVEQLIAAAAASYFQVGVVVLASTLLCCYAAVATPPPLDYVVSLVAAAFLLQTALFGIMLFAHSVSSAAIRHTPTRTAIVAGSLLLFVAFAFWVIGLVLLIVGGARSGKVELMPGTVPIAAAAAALGVWLVHIAYRRLLAADFD